MLQIMGTAILILLVLLGITELCRILVRFFLQVDQEQEMCLTLRFYGHREDAEYRLRSAAAQLRWTNGRKNCEIRCIDCCMDMETRKVCEILARKYPVIHILHEDGTAGVQHGRTEI